MIKDEEISILLTEVKDVYGYDFTSYSRVSIKRRINRLYQLDKFSNFKDFRRCLHTEDNYIKRFVEEITVNVTDLFRDYAFYKDIKALVLPEISKHSLIRIWHAGCSTGEEVFSMAILLEEANLLQRSLIYATDINQTALEKAQRGVYPISRLKKFTDNYHLAGGTHNFSANYSIKNDEIKFKDSFLDRIIFSNHNLASDPTFNQFHLIFCRNVLIYFDKNLQERVFNLFDLSLNKNNYLALGEKETLKASAVSSKFKPVGKEKIWIKT